MDKAKIAQTLQQLAGEKVVLGYLFGSYAHGRENEHSDIDVAILPSKPMAHAQVWELAQKLAISIGKDVDVINLMECNTVLRMQVIQQGVLLFDLQNKAPMFETDTYRMYQDLQFSRQDNLAAFKQRWVK